MSRGFADLIDTMFIKHVSGGNSVVQFKAYDQGRKKFQGRTLDGGLWLDEEPPADVYTECLARIAATDGIIMLTMTPLLGLSDVVGYFFPQPNTKARSLTQFEIYDVGHLDDEEKVAVIESYPAHERDARARGYPMLGEGKVFAIPQEAFECKHFDIPSHFRQLAGIDFGYGDHPFAAVRCALDPDTDILYVCNTHKDRDPKPPMHVAAVKSWGDGLIFHWPHDGHRQWGDSGPVAEVYRQAGLKIWREHSTFREGGYSPEAAVTHVLSRMQTGRLKIFGHLDDLFQEIATYHRKDGKLVQKKDDILSALFKCIMMLRFARTLDRHHDKLLDVQTDWDETGVMVDGY
jgi:phage terminase large subunit-like protein